MPHPGHLVAAVLLIGASFLGGPRMLPPAGAVRAMDRPMIVRGTVWDSTVGAPLSGARVFLEGTADTAVTDAAGAFSLEHALDGRYSVSFTHPRLDSLGYVPQAALVDLAEGPPATVRLAIPSVGAVRQALCAERAAGDSGVVVGSVVRPAGETVQNLEVRFDWYEHIEVTRRGTNVRLDNAASGTLTDAAGHFRVCGVPLRAPIRVIVRVDGRDRLIATLRLRELTPYRYDIRTW